MTPHTFAGTKQPWRSLYWYGLAAVVTLLSLLAGGFWFNLFFMPGYVGLMAWTVRRWYRLNVEALESRAREAEREAQIDRVMAVMPPGSWVLTNTTVVVNGTTVTFNATATQTPATTTPASSSTAVPIVWRASWAGDFDPDLDVDDD